MPFSPVANKSSRVGRFLLALACLHMLPYFMVTVFAGEPAHISPVNLRCEGVGNPLGIEAPHPRLSWKCAWAGNALWAAAQTAYEIQAATDREFLLKGKADLCDTGRVSSDQSVAIPYNGKPVPSASAAYWRVRLWDEKGNRTGWSTISRWDTGLLTPSNWKAAWITAPTEVTTKGAPRFHFQFMPGPGWREARLFLCSLGYHSLQVNGKKPDNRVLEPAQTDYEKRALYSTYLVTKGLTVGVNTIDVTLGNGWYNQDRVWGGLSYGKPALLVQLELEYPDGRRSLYVSGPDWSVTAGPITSNNIYAGESYDSRIASAASVRVWKPVVALAGPPVSHLVSSTMPPIRPISTITPIQTTEVKPGVLVYDMGQNFAGWIRLKVNAAAGTRVQMRFAEAIKPGTQEIDTASTGVFATGVEQSDVYICCGTGNASKPEIWEPEFTYHGFRYVEVTGLPTGIRPISVTGIVVHTDVAPIGDFKSSDAMLNKIHNAAVWTLVSNLHGHPTDCPARERCGWMGDAHGCAEMAAFNFDMANFWSKYMGDIETSWTDVLPSQIAPGKRATGTSGNPDWGVAVVLIPWYRYLYFGDAIELARDYPSMVRFVRELAKKYPDGIVTAGYGDWCPPGSVEPVVTPVALTSTAWFYRAAEVTALAAKALNRSADQNELNNLKAACRKAFTSKFFDYKRFSFSSQTGDAMALAFDLAPRAYRRQVSYDLARDVEAHGFHHNTGIFGSRYLFDALTESGHGDAAWKVLHQTDYPSIGRLFELGATTFWECWGEPELDKRWGARSLNHPMQAAYDAWFYQGLAGINADPERPGFKHIILKPQILPGLGSVNVDYLTPYGYVSVAWRHTLPEFASDIGPREPALSMRVTIPPNAAATLYLPVKNGVMESDITFYEKAIKECPGAKLLQITGNTAIINLLPGSYEIGSPL